MTWRKTNHLVIFTVASYSAVMLAWRYDITGEGFVGSLAVLLGAIALVFYFVDGEENGSGGVTHD